ncbi:MAG: hypothetical protein Q4B68_00490 [Bacteroidales bacterium]|nr:hypothetical protein [Bacteroidales bacterium]
MIVSVFALEIFAQESANEEWRSKMPVRRLHKKPAQIVVDPDDNTTYYIEPKEEKKTKKDDKKRKREEKEQQDRIAQYLKKKAQDDPNFAKEQEARKARQAAAQAKLDSLLAIEYTIEELEYGPQPLVWVDEPISESVAELKNKLNVTPDRVMPRNVSMEVTNNDMFFYFDVVNGYPQPLRFHAQYYADDPLAIEKIRFVVNGFNYYFTPSELPKTGKDGPRMYWETVDDKLTAADKDLIYALSHASWSRVVFIGSEGFSHVKKFTDDQIQDFYAVLALYLKMGGKL